jgi:Spy/CpxP family protein refolding chaperone
MQTLRKVIIAIASVALVGVGVNAFAHSGRGWSGGWGHGGSGMHYQDEYGERFTDQMSEEEYVQFEKKREAFFKETQDLRTSLFEKERELQSELAKKELDAARASQLQKEISNLQSQFDQKRINQMVEMRKLNTNAGRGIRPGGPMMGYGSSRRGGYCWQ